MSGPFGSSQWMYASGAEEGQSLRFNDDDSAYLNRTPSSAGNLKTWTWSGWVKRATLSTSQIFFGVHDGGSQQCWLGWNSGNTIQFFSYQGSTIANVGTQAVFRDVSAWYHLVVAFDAANTTMNMYINGVDQTLTFDTAISNTNHHINNSSYVHGLGRAGVLTGNDADMYLSDVYFIDGQALDADSFGETIDGYWKAKDYSGSYGTNGFRLEFDGDTTDSSGNGNDWTANNISAHDYVLDSPTNNFAVMSSAHPSSSNFTISDGNLSLAKSGTGTFGLYSQSLMPTTGKWYFEACITGRGTSDRTRVGLANYNSVTGTSTIQSSYSGVEISTGVADKVFIVENGSTTENDAFYTALSDNDVVRFAVDMDNGRLYIGVNGNWWNYSSSETGGDPTSGSGYVTNSTTIFDGSPMTAYSGFSAGTTTSTGQTFNFGQDSTFSGITSAGGNSDGNGKGDFKYAPPSGYLALCTDNFPEPTIVDGSDNFNPVLFTGNGSTQSITGVGFQPDWTWIKMRSDGGRGHALFDVVRGGNERLDTSSTQEGRTNEGNISFQSDGFNVTSSHPTVNDSGDSAVAWNWKAGGTASSNTDGSITSSVSANTDAGFSIVSYTGTASSATIGHGLGVKPSMIIVKKRTNASPGGTRGWAVWHQSLATDKVVELNTSAAQLTEANFFIEGNINSTTFGVGADYNTGWSDDYIAYCFADVDGYLKAGSYTGNGSSDGAFVYTGFRPAWIMVRSTGVGHWLMFDTTRHPSNVNDSRLFANLSNAEDSAYSLDLLSNGFKLRHTGSDFNSSGTNYIYLAFAETPLKYANAR